MKLIHSLTFHFLVNESTEISKNVPKLHHGHEITSRYIKSYMKKSNWPKLGEILSC